MDRDTFLAMDDRPIVPLAAPEWGNPQWYVRAMTAADAARAYKWFGDGDSDTDTMLHARIAAGSIVDANGERIFTDADADALATKNSAVLWRVFRLASDLNGLNETAEKRTESFAVARSSASSTA